MLSLFLSLIQICFWLKCLLIWLFLSILLLIQFLQYMFLYHCVPLFPFVSTHFGCHDCMVHWVALCVFPVELIHTPPRVKAPPTHGRWIALKISLPVSLVSGLWEELSQCGWRYSHAGDALAHNVIPPLGAGYGACLLIKPLVLWWFLLPRGQHFPLWGFAPSVGYSTYTPLTSGRSVLYRALPLLWNVCTCLFKKVL